MSERTIKEFVFNALLVQDSFNSLEKEGISVSSSDDFVAISRVVERDFSPRVWADAIRMSSVYTALYCIENTMFKWCAVGNTVKIQGRFVRKNNFVGTVADGQQLVLYVIGQNVLALHDTMNSIFLAQFVKHCF